MSLEVSVCLRVKWASGHKNAIHSAGRASSPLAAGDEGQPPPRSKKSGALPGGAGGKEGGFLWVVRAHVFKLGYKGPGQRPRARASS